MQTPPHVTNIMKGPPKFEVGLRPIKPSEWLNPDDQEHWLPSKNQLLNNSLSDVFGAFDDTLEVQSELAEMVSAHKSAPLKGNEPPLISASRLTSDDLIIMDKRDGAWTLVAATLCNPTFFDAGYALGKDLSLLHGPVPTGAYDLSGRIARVFDNLAPDLVLERFNWTVQWSHQRYTPNGAILREASKKAPLSEAKSMVHERVERQTIRILPKTRAIVFTIRIRISNLWDLLQAWEERKAFENAWINAPQNVREYKKWESLEHHVKYLLEESANQIRSSEF